MTPIDTGARHYRGPEAAAVPPQAPLPPAHELIDAAPGVMADHVAWEDPPAPPPAAQAVQNSIEVGFEAWFKQCLAEDVNPAGLMKSESFAFEAFKAGAAWHARQTAKGPIERIEPPLEGTVESRTIIAALTFFKEQVLAHNPPEIRDGEWMTVKAVDALIATIGINASAKMHTGER